MSDYFQQQLVAYLRSRLSTFDAMRPARMRVRNEIENRRDELQLLVRAFHAVLQDAAAGLPPTDKLRIDRLFAFISTAGSGEALIGGHLGIGTGWVPFVGADMASVDNLRPLAHDLGTATGREVTLAVFSVRQDVEVLEPRNGYNPVGGSTK